MAKASRLQVVHGEFDGRPVCGAFLRVAWGREYACEGAMIS